MAHWKNSCHANSKAYANKMHNLHRLYVSIGQEEKREREEKANSIGVTGAIGAAVVEGAIESGLVICWPVVIGVVAICCLAGFSIWYFNQEEKDDE